MVLQPVFVISDKHGITTSICNEGGTLYNEYCTFLTDIIPQEIPGQIDLLSIYFPMICHCSFSVYFYFYLPFDQIYPINVI